MGNKPSTATTTISNIETENATKAYQKLISKTFFNDLNSINIEGNIILPSPESIEAYHEARRRPFNVEFRGYPLVIVRPKTAQDVSIIVSFIREKCEGIVFCVQCGGHSTRCMMTDSICMDLVLMKTVRVDLEKSLVEVGGGAYLKDVDDALKPYNLGTPVGTYPLTGVGGLVLAGGYGFLSRMHGLSVDNLVEVEVVLANGKVVVANDENEYKDLIWGCRWGGGNFGIVTKFTFKVHKLPPKVYGGLKVYLAPTITSAMGVHKNFDGMLNSLPDNITGFIVMPAAEPVVPTLWAYFGDKPSVKDVPELNAKLGGWMCVMNNIKVSEQHYVCFYLLVTLLSPNVFLVCTTNTNILLTYLLSFFLSFFLYASCILFG